MRRARASVSAVALIVAALSVGPALAQEPEELPGPVAESSLLGYTRSDGTIVLTDESFCRFLLGSLWGDKRLTFVDLIDKSKRQKKAKRAAFAPALDEETVARCVDALGAYRTDPPEDDPLVAWSRRAPVVPEALVALLPADFAAEPLAQPDEIGPAARTSGYGDLVSAPFEMTAGTWLAEVDNLTCEAWAATLRDARDTDEARELGNVREYLYDLAPGHYFWDVTASDCDWSVDLVPVELGPDPDATPLPRIPVPRLAGEGWDHGGPNPEYLTASQARQALLDVGLTAGTCTQKPKAPIPRGRVFEQDPIVGVLVELGSPVDVRVTGGCDIFVGERVEVE